MSTVKRTLVNVSFYDPEAIQRKLEQMAARGWMIQKVGNLFWTYTKIPPQKLRGLGKIGHGESELLRGNFRIGPEQIDRKSVV